MSLFIGAEIAKSAYMFAVTMGVTLIGKTAHMYANMQQRGGVQSSKSGWRWKGEQTMSEIVREMTREELVAVNNKLRAENEKLKAELQEARLAVEHNRHVAEENQLKYELHYRDGVIYGMKYALKCNGVSGGELDRRYE